MVFVSPWRTRCGIAVLFTLLCARAPLQAQDLFEQARDLVFGSDAPAQSSNGGSLLGNFPQAFSHIGLVTSVLALHGGFQGFEER